MTKAEKRAKEWEAKKAEYQEYKQSDEYKELVRELSMQMSVHRDFPHDPPYNPREAHNYLYVFDKNDALIGKEIEVKEPEKDSEEE